MKRATLSSLRTSLTGAAALAVAGIGLVFAASTAVRADIINITLSSSNGAFTGSGPYANVEVDLTSSTVATITFTSDTSGGFTYLMNGADVNINATTFTAPTASSVTATGPSTGGFTAPSGITVGSGGNDDGFGTFNLNIGQHDGYPDSSNMISFSVTDTSGTWASASNVLALNGTGFDAAFHAFECIALMGQ
jgi:hypothetical protein